MTPSSLYPLLLKYPELRRILECYINRINSLPSVTSNNALSGFSAPYIPNGSGMVGASTIIIDTNDVLLGLQRYYRESLLETLDHLIIYFNGSKPYELLHFLDDYIESNVNSLVVRSLRKTLLQKYTYIDGSFYVSDAAVNIEELLPLLEGYNFEIYRIVRDIKSRKWHLSGICSFIENALTVYSLPQTHQFLHKMREHLACKYGH